MEHLGDMQYTVLQECTQRLLPSNVSRCPLDVPIRLLSGGPAKSPDTEDGKAAEGIDSAEQEAAQQAAQEAQVLDDCHRHVSALIRFIASLYA